MVHVNVGKMCSSVVALCGLHSYALSYWLLVLLNATVSLIISYLLHLSISEKGALKFPTLLVNSFISAHNFVRSATHILTPCCWVHIY